EALSMDIRAWKHLDPLIMVTLAALTALGVVMIYSASLSGTPPDEKFFDHPYVRQVLYAIFGFIGLMLVAALDYRMLGRIVPGLYLFMIGSLIAVLFIGPRIFGARRWIEFPLFQFQPAEVAKFILIIAYSKYMADNPDKVRSFSFFLRSILLFAPAMVLIFLEPDLGTVIVVAMIWLGLSVVGGVRLRYLGALILGVLLLIPLIYNTLLHGYMRERVETFIHPEKDPFGESYNILQAEISVGSGGMWGKGYLQGSQTQLNYLRVQSTDFIFSVMGEELGFVGAMMLFTLFLVLMFRALHIAESTRDAFGRYMVAGIVVMLVLQIFINIGVNTRLLPATGIPLPFISQGGTALLLNLMAFGLIQGVAARRNRV
ncbi:MAG: rod shape-determining protein RodA, partial [Dehalococcoidia bacterium]|nr:rod shape-determining protein RodA [Dehalococcoidia bacterium]